MVSLETPKALTWTCCDDDDDTILLYIINERRKEEFRGISKAWAKAQTHLDLPGRKFAFFSLSLRREEDATRARRRARIYNTQNKTNVPLGGGIFELSSNWWSFAFLIGTNCCARRWTTGRQTWCVSLSRVIFVWGDYRKEHKNNNSPPEPKREIFRFGALGLERQKNTRIW